MRIQLAWDEHVLRLPARSVERCRMAAGSGLLTITPPMPMISLTSLMFLPT